MSILLEGGKETAKKLNDLARHQMITKVLRDISVDLMICEIEGWDKTEYIRMLQDELNLFKVRKERE